MTLANPVKSFKNATDCSQRKVEENRCVFVGDKPSVINQAWFAARLPGCVIGIKIACEVAHAEPNVIELALALGKEEQLVQYIEKWLNVELDFVPAKQKPNNPISLELVVPSEMVEQSTTVIEPPRVELSLPVHLIIENSVPDWKDLIVNWNDCPCEIRLTEFLANTEEIEKLSSGALVLLENSFLENWQVAIRTRFNIKEQNLSLYSHALLDICARQLTLNNIKPSENMLSSEHQLEILEGWTSTENLPEHAMISCMVKTSLPVDLLLGLRSENGQLTTVERYYNQLDIGQLSVSVQLNDKQVGEGGLLKVGDGYAVVLN